MKNIPLLLASIMLITLTLSADMQLAPDGSYVSGDPQLAPDGTWVGEGDIEMAPDGSFLAVPEYEQPVDTPYEYPDYNVDPYIIDIDMYD